MNNYIILDNQLKTEEFIHLWRDAGWGDIPQDIVETALKNSYATFSVLDGECVIAMARLLGDGSMSFFLKDFAVLEEYRGKGVGSTLLSHVDDYIRAQLKPGWKGFLELVSAKDKEAFYCKNGYCIESGAESGAAMYKWIDSHDKLC